ncbi:MAG: helix-turn-helix transcriptional regulator [Bacillota bacterium]
MAHLRARAQTTLAPGSFFGAAMVRGTSASFDFNEAEATCPQEEVPVHTHASAHFVLVLRGDYLTAARNRSGTCAPGTLIFNPTGTTHRDRFVQGAGRFLSITPSDDVARMLDGALSVPLAVEDPRAGLIAARLRSLVAGAASAAALENVALDLAGALAASVERETRVVPSWLTAVQRRLREECPADLRIAALAREAGVHPVHLARAFRRYFHIAPADYLARCRVQRARRLLAESRRPIVEIALDAGFSEQSHLTHAFRRALGTTPAAYRRLKRR